MASCKDGKKDNPNQPKDQETNEMPAKNSEMEIENDRERQAMPEDAAGVGPAAQTGGSTGASNILKMGTEDPETGTAINLEAIYSELEMTDEQIQKFSTSMGNEQLNTLQNASGELPGNLYENMESELESILDKEQFQKYQEWKKGR
jgi:hypothetical protein